jgi:hypothetical protein
VFIATRFPEKQALRKTGVGEIYYEIGKQASGVIYYEIETPAQGG